MSEHTIRHEGDRCIMVSLGQVIDESTGLKCLALADQLRALNLAGVQDIVASYVSVAVHYTPDPALGNDPAGAIKEAIHNTLTTLSDQSLTQLSGQVVRLPICYGGAHGPDLEEAATMAGLSPEAFIQAHHAQPLRVFSLGFAPGQPYIGVHDERFAIPRRAIPRTAVPPGSLGVANRQSTLYPNVLPGGWMIIGATPVPLFDAHASEPSRLNPGDTVYFEPISEAEFDAIRRANPTRESRS